MQQPTALEAAISIAVRAGTGMHIHASGGSASAAAASSEAMDLSAMQMSDESSTDVIGRLQEQLNALSARQNRNNGTGSNGRGAQGASGGFQGPKGLPTYRGLTEQQVKEYMGSNRCFKCSKKGHRSFECRSATVKPNTAKGSQ